MAVKIEITFGGTVVDVTQYAKRTAIRRGREREIDQFVAGSATIVLDNTSRIFDPLYVAGPYYGLIRPRQQVRVTYYNIDLFVGFVDEWDFSYNISNLSEAVVTCVDGLTFLAQTKLDEYTNVQESARERIITILNLPEVNYTGSTNLSAGVTDFEADTIEQNTNTLDYLQTIALADLGRLFVDGSGVLRYRDRVDGVVSEAQVIFCDPDNETLKQIQLLSSATLWFDATRPEPITNDGTGVWEGEVVLRDATLWFDALEPSNVPSLVGFNNIEVDYRTDRLYNRVNIQITGSDDIFVAFDQSSIDTFGTITYTSQPLPFLLETSAQQYADYLLSIYKNPQVRVVSIGVLLQSTDETNQKQLLGLEIGDAVRTIWTPNSIGSAQDFDSLIEGLQLEITPAETRIRYSLTPRSRAGFILDDLVDGLLDTSEITY